MIRPESFMRAIINGIFKIIIRFIFRREMYIKFKYLSHNKKTIDS
jgi:hypothetical protein